MASRTIAYFAVLLVWFLASAAVGYGSISQAEQLLTEVSQGPSLNTTVGTMVSNSSVATSNYHINWGGFDSWAANLAKAK